MTIASLKSRTAKDLAELARRRGIPGWHSMRKEQLVRVLSRKLRAAANGLAKRADGNGRAAGSRRSGASKAAARSAGRTLPRTLTPAQRARVQRRIHEVRVRDDRRKNLGSSYGGAIRDRLVAMVRDPFWLHAWWELGPQGIGRATAAMGQDWHTARPVLRLVEVVGRGSSGRAEKVIRDIEIHGAVRNWYVPVDDPPKSFRLDIGYLAANGRFFSLARSNLVTTPRAGMTDAVDQNWKEVADNFDRIYAMSGGYARHGDTSELQELFEERLRRPMSAPGLDQAAVNGVPGRRRKFSFELDAELIVYGKTEAESRVTLQGEPVRLRQDGTFTVRFNLPNCRQVIPAVAYSPDGAEQRTIVLAVERNTKAMEPVLRDMQD